MKPQLPAPTEGSADVAKLATGVGSIIASMWFPGAAFAGPVLNFLIDKFVERPKRILMEALREGDLTLLTDEKRAEFIPMAYRFMEAAKEGEYEHNLRVLGAYIAQELQQDVSEASNVARLARRIEGLSSVEIKVMRVSP